MRRDLMRACGNAARRMYEGAGLGPEDVDIFNPYDGYAPHPKPAEPEPNR